MIYMINECHDKKKLIFEHFDSPSNRTFLRAGCRFSGGGIFWTVLRKNLYRIPHSFFSPVAV